MKLRKLYLLLPVALAVVGVAALTSTLAGAQAEGAAEVTADLESIGALEFGTGGVLFIGDSQGAAVWAFDLGEISGAAGSPVNNLEDLDGKIAAMLGAGVRDISIEDLAVHEPSGTAFLSITRGRGDEAVPVLVSVARDGKIAEVPLDGVQHSRLSLDSAPARNAKLYSWNARTLTVTDLEFIDGELFIAGLSNEEFASVLRRTPYPFSNEPALTGLEIYHGAHGVYETFAPIFSFIPYEVNGEDHLLAGYLCTPLVTFPLDEVRERERLRGKTIAELGWGNIPNDMVAYKGPGGEEFVLISNTRRGTMKIKASDIAAAQKRPGITTEVGPRVGVEDHSVPIGKVFQLAELDASRILVLGRSMDNGSLYMQAFPKSRL